MVPQADDVQARASFDEVDTRVSFVDSVQLDQNQQPQGVLKQPTTRLGPVA